MKKIQTFLIELNKKGKNIEVFINEQHQACLQVPQRDLVYYRSKIANAGLSFTHPPLESGVIVLDKNVVNLVDVEKLIQDLKISYKKINKMEVEHVL